MLMTLMIESLFSLQGRGFYVDRSDSSITRTDEHFRAIFARAGLRVAHSQMQPGFPRAIFPVWMYALVPGSEARGEGAGAVAARV